MEENQNDLATVIRNFLPDILTKRKLTSDQLKALNAITNCRTSKLGGSILACKDCGTIKYVFHSCRNRHCPRCQGIDKELWISDRKQELLPVKYFTHKVYFRYS